MRSRCCSRVIVRQALYRLSLSPAAIACEDEITGTIARICDLEKTRTMPAGPFLLALQNEIRLSRIFRADFLQI